MKQYGLLGEHLSHSYSKIIHSSIFKALNLAASYSLIECKESELKSYIEQLKQGVYSGFNVTIPYKKKILPYLDAVDDKAKTIGSVNTVYLKEGKVWGTNTDYDGFLETIKKYQVDVFNKSCYILGTGGASLAVNKVLTDLGGNCSFVSRNPKNDELGYLDLETKEIDILVNTTPVGMFPNIEASPVSKEIARKANCVIDIIFNPRTTQLLKDANSNINGLYMLVMQALKAEQIWQQKEFSLSVDELIANLELLLDLPSEVYEQVKDLPFEKDKLGQSSDLIYLFDDRYVLKISKNHDQLKREKEIVDWFSDKIPGSKSIAFIESNSASYYLRTHIKGDSLIAKRFLDHPDVLIEVIKEVVQVLRGLDHRNCPFQSKDSVGNRFVHGDLCLPNIFVDEQNHFCGFIDLGNAGLGDIWYDYAWLLWSFEYNLKTNHYNKKLLEALNITIDDAVYKKYIPMEYIKMLQQ